MAEINSPEDQTAQQIETSVDNVRAKRDEADLKITGNVDQPLKPETPEKELYPLKEPYSIKPKSKIWVEIEEVGSEDSITHETTMAMEIDRIGCFVRTKSRQGEAMTFVPGCSIRKTPKGKVFLGAA